MGCHPVGQGPAHGRILKPAPVTAKLPAGEPSRDHVGMVVGHDEATLGRGSRDRVRGMEHLAARRPRGGPETQGSEGAQPPASLRRGRTRSVWPHGVNWLSHKTVAEPALRTRAKLKAERRHQQRSGTCRPTLDAPATEAVLRDLVCATRTGKCGVPMARC